MSFIWLALYNVRFWELSAAAMWHPSAGAVLFMASLFVLAWVVLALLLLLSPTRGVMRAAASAMFVIAAFSAYFMSEYGAIMNQEMMRNVLQTDHAEVAALLNADIALHGVLLGIVPALLVWRVRLPETSWRTQIGQRAIAVVVALGVAVAGMFASSADYATFFREHKPVRYTLNPMAPIVSMVGLVAGSNKTNANAPLIDPAGKIERTAAPAAKPLVLFLVIGETARAANFQLGGYARETNPELAQISGLTYFSNTSSCGTSTAISVPCLFSHLPRTAFKVDAAGRYKNLLDSLVQAGFDVQWRDNNSGCKGVCARVTNIDYNRQPDPKYCHDSNCFDAVMLEDLPETLRKIERDTVIVFHQKGSHGPFYSERYPPRFEKFQPACRSNQLQHCSQQEIANAYDNTIAYTDHVLASQIRLLREASSRVDSVLIYVSDHGESLGENGIYLHGMPYAFAPAAQKEVPMLLWTSEGYVRRAHVQPDCLRTEAKLPVSHDFFYHTVLGAAELRNQAYDRRLDLIAGCRRGGGSE
ncbi:phosphoethanolamine--lipid A transferase EptA [Steroidobacter agaridevorans]|uniref:Phosphoethanolamine--lipid A transferase EptA n=1 Tax=Steroidobacter agaridevorans TaxID=2695856 RepID=A0A829YCZ0_9GAMM|nr:phosphoethanolamine--lipid A transferase [Steroidobacter agaridevorans]GFE81137.1 phosphoethanolamine--lipid A transferase EptA [Steroidobacter agaridevorans]GFE88978.1 phosphoethanolamine--lipid A transferase EptA [Steroidobacter agaridevorans]